MPAFPRPACPPALTQRENRNANRKNVEDEDGAWGIAARRPVSDGRRLRDTPGANLTL
jgi:hypothetical protein